MRALTRVYHPITGTPFHQDEDYRELTPCAALSPYIRCFRGSVRPLPARPSAEDGIVIPDTCMDIIFHVDYADNRLSSVFCALDEHSYRTPASRESGARSATFAIRFYAWTACLFAEDSLQGSVNGVFRRRRSSVGTKVPSCRCFSMSPPLKARRTLRSVFFVSSCRPGKRSAWPGDDAFFTRHSPFPML